MIKRLLQSGLSLLVYFCLATLISQAVLLAYLGFTWRLNRNKLVQIMAVLQNVDLFAIKEQADIEKEQPISEQVSYQQIMEVRARNVYHLELKEQALKGDLEQLRFDQHKLAEDTRRYKQLRDAFNAQLLEMQQGAVASGEDEVVLILASAKPKQAKEQLVLMLDNDELDKVVSLLAKLPDTKRSKIIAEFKTPAESEQLGEILHRIREGIPDANLPEETRKKLQESLTSQL